MDELPWWRLVFSACSCYIWNALLFTTYTLYIWYCLRSSGQVLCPMNTQVAMHHMSQDMRNLKIHTVVKSTKYMLGRLLSIYGMTDVLMSLPYHHNKPHSKLRYHLYQDPFKYYTKKSCFRRSISLGQKLLKLSNVLQDWLCIEAEISKKKCQGQRSRSRVRKWVYID